MRPFKELYDNKNHADLQELEKSYDRTRKAIKILIDKTDKVVEEAILCYLTEAVVKKEREKKTSYDISIKEINEAGKKAVMEKTKSEWNAYVASEHEFFEKLQDSMETGKLSPSEADQIAEAFYMELPGQN